MGFSDAQTLLIAKIEMLQRERMLNHEKIIKNIYLYENLRFKV